MRRSALLVIAVLVATLAFAPAAMAQMDDNPSADDRGMDDNGGGRGFDDNPSADDMGADDNGGDRGGRGFDDNPSADDLMESPAASATATSSATAPAGDDATATVPDDDATATATAGDDATATARADDDVRAAAGGRLPSTGGPSVTGLVSGAAMALLVGSGLVAARLVRRDR